MNDKYNYVQTFKSGRFYFHLDYDEKAITPLVSEADILGKTISGFPTLPALESGFIGEIIRRSIRGTAKIEGNLLNEEQVSEILDRKNFPITDEVAGKEIRNLQKIYEEIRKIEANESAFVFDEDTIKHIHQIITGGIEYEGNTPGAYRNHKVNVGDTSHGGVYTPPKTIEDIKKLMAFFVEWMNSGRIKGVHPVLRAFSAHYYLSLIHPFGDGNGRTARVIEAILLRNNGHKYSSILIWEYYSDNLDDYYLAFSNSIRQRNLTPFFSFCLRGLISVLYEIKERMMRLINRHLLRDFIELQRKKGEISARQHSLLRLMMEYNIEFAPKEITEKEPLRILFKGVSKRTVARDLAKLKSINLLIEDNSKYRINPDYLKQGNQ